MKIHWLIGVALLMAGSVASAAQWQIEITNVTPGQTFTPILVAAHYGDSGVPGIGAPASDALAMLAEGATAGSLAISWQLSASFCARNSCHRSSATRVL